MRNAVFISAAVAAMLVAGGARAQTPTPRERFARGVELAAEGDHRTALIEFRAAYEATQNPEVLFNIAATHEQLNEYVEALESIERYQRLAPPAAVARHRAEVVAALARLAQRVGTLRVGAATAGARCALDGRDVAMDALRAGIRVSAGQRSLRCEADGFEPLTRAVDVASSATASVDVALARRQAELTVTSDRPGAEVRVDGAVLGRTPLSGPLRVDEGSRRVEVSHPGYESVERVVEARGVGARVEANLRWRDPVPPEVAARLVVRASEARVSATVDGRAVPTDGSLALPPGLHRLRVSRADFLDEEREVTLAPGATAREDVALRPTPAYRDAYLSRARRQRATWRVLLGAGAVLAVGGGILLGVTLPPVLDADQRATAAQSMFQQCSAAIPPPNCTMLSSGYAGLRDAALTERDEGVPGVIAGAALAGVGLVGLIVGAVLAADADPVDRFERPPVFRVAAGPGGVALFF